MAFSTDPSNFWRAVSELWLKDICMVGLQVQCRVQGVGFRVLGLGAGFAPETINPSMKPRKEPFHGTLARRAAPWNASLLRLPGFHYNSKDFGLRAWSSGFRVLSF